MSILEADNHARHNPAQKLQLYHYLFADNQSSCHDRLLAKSFALFVAVRQQDETHPLPFRVASALRLVCNLHLGVALGIGNGQEHAVGHDDSQNQAVEPGVLHYQDCQLPDWAGARKDTEGQVSLLRLEHTNYIYDN